MATTTNHNRDDDNQRGMMNDDDDDDHEKNNKSVVPTAASLALVPPSERDPLILVSSSLEEQDNKKKNNNNTKSPPPKNHPLYYHSPVTGVEEGPLPPVPRRLQTATPPRRPGATTAATGAVPAAGWTVLHPLPVIDARRRAASTTTVERRQRPVGQQSRHFRNRSSLGQIMVDDILPQLQSESNVLRGQFQQSLYDAQRGSTYFLDMSMTRSLSVLPEDMTDLVAETVLSHIPHHHPKPTMVSSATLLGSEEEADEDVDDREGGGPPKKVSQVEESSSSMALQCASLVLAVMAVSSNGTALTLLHGVPPALKLYWRMSLTGLVLFVLALPRLTQHGWPIEMSAWPKLVSLVCAAICFAGQGLCFVHALQYTSIGNVVIGANSQALLLVLGKLVGGQAVHWLEGGGVLLAFVGCLMCAQDEAQERVTTTTTTTASSSSSSSLLDRSVGELLAFAAGIFGVLYLVLAKSIRPHMPVSLFVSTVMLLGSVLVIPFCYLAAPPPGHMVVTWTNDPNYGFFGWSNWHRIWIMAHIVLVCNLLGTVGFVRAMQYFDNLIIAVATLLEPLIATIIAFVLGVGLLPGPLGWLGNLIVVIGTLGVVLPTIHHTADGTEGGASAAAH